MYIAVDDTDSREGMCTTYLLSEIIIRSGMDLIGYPHLVRLNPAIKHKTRGNGALCANLGEGKGLPLKIGSFNGKDIMSYPDEERGTKSTDLVQLASEIVGEMAVLDEPDTNPGIVASCNEFDPSFYWKAVREEVSIDQAEAFIKKQGGEYRKFKNGRGIIGAAAAISWPAKQVTYEFLAYTFPKGDHLGADLKLRIASMANRIPGSFNNIDRRNNHAAIFPSERTPVVLGIRAIKPEALLAEGPEIVAETGSVIERCLLFRTNQATDDHIIPDPAKLRNGCSYSIEGTVKVQPYSISGGHYFAELQSRHMELAIAAFEPTKEFRKTFSKLAPGDNVRVFGTYKENCLNVEKMEIKSVSDIYNRVPPECGECGDRMHSRGKGDYRCYRCGNRGKLASYELEPREIDVGKFDVPVMSRRHLSRPFELDFNDGVVTLSEVYA